MKTTYALHATTSGNFNDVAEAAPAQTVNLADVIASLNELAFIAETIAHLQGKEAALLPAADRARALVARLTPQ